ncbi:MAG: type III-A CRISPR-associated RAMP protein Csm3 [Hahellaceae bacterium]|nr:type III-A CRISPR-associated RAMP protein Csm3 [Hahellaceae bacterium]
MKLNRIIKIKGKIEVLSGLHIGGSEGEMRIGGIDNTVVKHPYTGQPYIPGSSIKGKMRSLLEWKAGLVGFTEGSPVNAATLKKGSIEQQRLAREIAQIFGIAGTADDEKLARELGPTRASFWDCNLSPEWSEARIQRNELFTEAKAENTINRITGVALHPRQTERVPAQSLFDFTLTFRSLEGDDSALLSRVLEGLRLIELDSLGGCGSRGYGKVRFVALTQDGNDIQAGFEAIQPFGNVA